jgi:hypothetical protein
MRPLSRQDNRERLCLSYLLGRPASLLDRCDLIVSAGPDGPREAASARSPPHEQEHASQPQNFDRLFRRHHDMACGMGWRGSIGDSEGEELLDSN